MASLLNMLNNFLGSTGKPSLFNLDSINSSQNTDFKELISNILNGAEVDQQTLSGLLLDPTGGVDLPLPAAAGNELPPLLATAAVSIEASLPLPDAEVSPSPLPDAEAPLSPLPNDSKLLALQTAVASPASTSVVAPATLPVSPTELPTTPEFETPINATLQTPQLNGADVHANGLQNPEINNVIANDLAVTDRAVRVAETDAFSRPVKLDSTQQSAEQAVANTPNSAPRAINTASLEPSPVVSAPVIGATETPGNVTQLPTALPVDGRPQVLTANDAITPATASANVSTPNTAVQTPSQPTAQLADLNAAVPTPLVVKDPQQLLVEQALGSSTTSDSDTSAEAPRQSLLPPSQPLRAAPTAQAPLQAAEANLANVANMLNQGQTMNSLNERLQFMLLNGQNSAEIQLDPPELGSLQVRVTTRHEQTSVIFVAPNNVVREALEQQLPRLRDALEGAGLQLQDANVFAQTDDKPGAQPQSYADVEAADSLLAEELDDGDRDAAAARTSMQLVDAYI